MSPAPPPPVFLVGCHRSGTTLLRYLLDTHSQFACPPESKFIGGLKSFYEYPQALRALESMEISRDAVLSEIRSAVEQVFQRYADKKKKRRWIDKTPNYYMCLAFIDLLFRSNVRYIFLVRHPMDCIHSLEAYFINPTPEHEDPEIARQVRDHGNGRPAWAHYWVEANQRIIEFQRDRTARSLLLRYEDLTTEPEAVLRNICEFLNEAYEAQMLTDAFRVPHDGGYADDKILETNRVCQDRRAAWKAWAPEEIGRVWEIVEPLASRLEYGLGSLDRNGGR